MAVPAVIAALYVEKDGAYYGLPDVDPWDEERDARLYDGPWPVVAHPPCNRWVSYGSRWKRGDDGGCFEAALNAVRLYGGVLEHPARSQAWRVFELPRPSGPFWLKSFTDPGWVCEIDQYLYGFRTRKTTWLYYVGETIPLEVSIELSKASKGCETLWSTQRSKTPPAFRDLLIKLASSANLEAV